MGVGIETSSHKYGLIQHVLESIEVVVADGNVIKCSEVYIGIIRWWLVENLVINCKTADLLY